MADQELTLKLARRLEIVDEMNSDGTVTKTLPPPVPVIPEKVVANPYVAADDATISIDDLITRTLKRNECAEENNEDSINLSASITTDDRKTITNARAPAIGLPPKQTLADLLAKDGINSSSAVQKKLTDEAILNEKQTLASAATFQRPTVIIERSKKKLSTQTKSLDNDDSELQRKLAIQRQKKCYDTPSKFESNTEISLLNNSDLSSNQTESSSLQACIDIPTLGNQIVECDADAKINDSCKTEKLDQKSNSEQKNLSEQLDIKKNTNTLQSEPSEVPPSVGLGTPPKQSEDNTIRAKEPHDGPLLKRTSSKFTETKERENSIVEDLKKSKFSVEEIIVLKDIESRKDDRPFSPSKELLKMIQHENEYVATLLVSKVIS